MGAASSRRILLILCSILWQSNALGAMGARRFSALLALCSLFVVTVVDIVVEFVLSQAICVRGDALSDAFAQFVILFTASVDALLLLFKALVFNDVFVAVTITGSRIF